MSQTTPRREPATPTDAFRPMAGLGEGLSAFLLVYLVVLGLVFVEAAASRASFGFVGFVRGGLQWTYAAHFGAVAGEPLLSTPGLTVPAVVFYLVPAVLLVLKGRSLVAGRSLPSPLAAAVAGGSTAVGYAAGILLVPAVFAVGADVLRDTLGASGLFFPMTYTGNPLRLVVVAGVVYPLLFGGLGGYLVYRRRSGRPAAPAAQGRPE